MSHHELTHKIIVRRLLAGDQEQITDHFLRLDPQSRRSRFCGTVGDDGVKRYAQDIFRDNAIVCGAYVDGQLRGVAELRGVVYPWPSQTEVAFSVDPSWQNLGLGEALFDRIFAIAQNRGIRTLHMVWLKENTSMKHLATKHHAKMHVDHDGVEAVLHPLWPTPMSVAKEIVGEASGVANMMFNLRHRVHLAKGYSSFFTPRKLSKS